MKKIIFILATTFLLTGCNQEEKIMTCKRTNENEEATMNFMYQTKHKAGYVTHVHSEEVIEVKENTELLETYKTEMETMYSIYSELEYYTYEIKVEENKVICITDIDYTKIDTNKMIQINPLYEKLIRNGKISIIEMKNSYENSDMTCETV